MIRLEMIKLQYDINREAAVSVLPFGQIDQYRYLTSEEILLSDRSRIIDKAQFTYFRLGKAFEKQIKKLKIKEKNI